MSHGVYSVKLPRHLFFSSPSGDMVDLRYGIAGVSALIPPVIVEKLALLPERPGCYIFKGERGEVLYVGKAVSLKHRVRSYFQSPKNLTAKVLTMVRQVEDLEHIITDNEVEALILESNLIKRYRPKYNIRLRDDKQYPYLKITLQDEWPQVMVVRRMKPDGARYFGPFTSSESMRETLKVLRRVFPYRSCSDRRLAQGGPPCLYYHIGRCLAPCDGKVNRERYDEMIRELILFLEGKEDDLLKRIERRMKEAADNLEFEKAAEYRDQLRALEKVLEKQKIVSAKLDDQDVIALARDEEEAAVQIFFVREGKVVGREHFLLAASPDDTAPEIIEAFIKQYYDGMVAIPREILVADLPPDAEVIGRWLTEKRGARVQVTAPRRGEKRRMVRMVEKNARILLQQETLQRERHKAQAEEALAQLQEQLNLPEPPRRIECFDISNTQGANIVASMVVFENGQPKKSDYRKFRIRDVTGAPNDFASMQEALYRRFRRAIEERKALQRAEQGEEVVGEAKFADLPDLLIIDGGKGQLSAAREVLRLLELDQIPTFGLAKQHEWLFEEGRAEPIILPRDSQGLYLLQRVRDEAHRFAVSYHRELRAKTGIKSVLEEVPGIGPKRRRELLKAFGSLEEIRRADPDELAAVPGMTRKAAKDLLEYLGELQ